MTEHSLRVTYDDGEFVILTLHDCGPARAVTLIRVAWPVVGAAVLIVLHMALVS